VDARQHLRGERGGRQALQEPGGHQLTGRLGDRAQQAGGGEHAQADQQHPLAAERVAEPAADDDQRGVDDAVGGHHQLQRAGRGAQVGADLAQRDVDAEHRHDRDDGRGQRREEGDRVHPAEFGRRCRGDRRGREIGAHGRQRAVSRMLVVRAW
jgi:hypothetical protein